MKNLVKENRKMRKEIDKLFRRGKLDGAIELCRQYLSKDPNDTNIHLKLADLYLENHLNVYKAKNSIDDAITEYQMVLETFIDSFEIYFKLGKAFYFKGEFDRALKYFNLALEKSPNFYDAYYMIAKTYTRKNDFQQALKYAELAIKVGGLKSSQSHLLKAHLIRLMTFRDSKIPMRSHVELCLFFLTLPFSKEAIKTTIKHLNYCQFIPLILTAIFFINTKRIDKAIEIYQKAIEKAPRLAFLYSCLGYVYRIIGRYEDAICEYKMAIWLDSLNVSAYKSLCELYEDLGKFDNAIETYLKLIDIQPYVAEYQSNLGNILYLKGDLDGAIGRYQNAITLNPNPLWTSVIAQTMGYVFQDGKNNNDAAISAYQSAFLLTPKDLDIYINLGSVYYEKGLYENALLIYKRALEIDPKNAKIHCNIAFLYWGIGNIEEAIKEYKLSLEYDSKYDITYNNLGVIYLDDLGLVKQAYEYFKKAVDVNPNYALAYYNLARATAILGDKVEAAKLYNLSAQVNDVTKEIDPADIKEKINELFE